jgi:chemotaxis family two-component system sensor kinase Cph1
MRYRAPPWPAPSAQANALAIDGRPAHALTLALHELATNAARYGAPSIQRGSFEIERLSAGGHLDLVWRERSGAAFVTPERSGFGSFRTTPDPGVAFCGAVEPDFSSESLTGRLRAPAA